MMNYELKCEEEIQKSIIHSVMNKRNAILPTVSDALDMMSHLNSTDVASLSRVSKPTPEYETFAEPLLVIFQ